MKGLFVQEVLLDMKGKSGFTLIEIIIAVALLAVAGTVAVHLFVHAHVNKQLARDTDQAVFQCSAWIETIKSSPEDWINGNPSESHQNVVVMEPAVYVVYFDKEWNPVADSADREQHAEYALNINLYDVPGKAGLWNIEARMLRLKPYPLRQEDQIEILKLSAMVNDIGEVGP